MASDLNSVPALPQTQNFTHSSTQTHHASSPVSSRRPSQVMGPPSVPYSPSLQATAGQMGNEQGQVATGAGPLRHPKPLTSCDLHSMLEKEQEAMVNRLTKELAMLRQQTASVASTTSSTSATLNDPTEPVFSSFTNPPIFPTTSRRHRSSSSLSSYVPAVQGSRTGSVAGIAPSRDGAMRPSTEATRPGQSRDPSIASPRVSLEQASPGISSSVLQSQGDHALSNSHGARSAISPQVQSPAIASSRYEEILHQRAEVDAIKRENEALRRRVRELEQSLRKYRDHEATSSVEATPSPSEMRGALSHSGDPATTERP